MKKIFRTISIYAMLVLFIIPVFIVNASLDLITISSNDGEFVPGEIIVKFKNGVENKEISKINSIYGLSVISSNKFAGFKRLKVPQGKSVFNVIDILNKNPNVEYAEPNFIAHIDMIPNDPYYNYQWHLHDLSQGGINMEPAWSITTGSGAVVAIVDTGVRVGSDLSSTCFVPGYDFVNYDNDPIDDNGHGTHVAGTVAQSTNNNNGVAGIAFGACLMPVKVLNKYGSGTYSDIVEGIYYAVDNGAKIISMSFGGSSGSQALQDALAYAYNNGVTCIAASGNNGQNGVLYPAAYDSYVIAVGATQFNKTRTPYSNYGSSLDLMAPGGNLNLDQNGDGYGDGVLQQTFKLTSGGNIQWGYYFYQGTSMATPHVSGVAALLYSEGVDTPDNIREVLQATAIDLGSTGWDIYYGYGLINAYDALQYIQGDNPPTCSITSPSNGATVMGDVTIQVTATDDVGITKVDFYVDSSYIGSDTTPPYSLLWDSTKVADGTHTITAIAYDTASQSKSDSINVFIDNINEPPVANAGLDKNVYINEIVEFDGSGSYDPDGIITSYKWDFGDNSQVLYGIIVTHTYSTVGIYIVTLTVTDNKGLTDSDETIVWVEETPSEFVEFSDSFENGQWNGKWVEDYQNDWFTSTQRKTDGAYSAEVDGIATNATLTMLNAIDLSGKSGATLTYSWFIESNWDSGEYIALDIYNGVRWIEVKRLRGNVDTENIWHHEIINLNNYLVNGFKVRFRAKVSASDEDGNIDNIKIISYS